MSRAANYVWLRKRILEAYERAGASTGAGMTSLDHATLAFVLGWLESSAEVTDSEVMQAFVRGKARRAKEGGGT